VRGWRALPGSARRQRVEPGGAGNTVGDRGSDRHDGARRCQQPGDRGPDVPVGEDGRGDLDADLSQARRFVPYPTFVPGGDGLTLPTSYYGLPVHVSVWCHAPRVRLRTTHILR